MIYLFYTALGLAAVISIGTIKAQIAHIKGLKGMYKEESRKAHALQLEVLDFKAKLRESPYKYDDHLDPTDLILLTNEDKEVAKKATAKKVANAKSPGKPKPANTKATRTDSSPSV